MYPALFKPYLFECLNHIKLASYSIGERKVWQSSLFNDSKYPFEYSAGL